MISSRPGRVGRQRRGRPQRDARPAVIVHAPRGGPGTRAGSPPWPACGSPTGSRAGSRGRRGRAAGPCASSTTGGRRRRPTGRGSCRATRRCRRARSTTGCTAPTPAAKAAKSRSGRSTSARSTTLSSSSMSARGTMPAATVPLHSPMLWPGHGGGFHAQAPQRLVEEHAHPQIDARPVGDACRRPARGAATPSAGAERRAGPWPSTPKAGSTPGNRKATVPVRRQAGGAEPDVAAALPRAALGEQAAGQPKLALVGVDDAQPGRPLARAGRVVGRTPPVEPGRELAVVLARQPPQAGSSPGGISARPPSPREPRGCG